MDYEKNKKKIQRVTRIETILAETE
jgi:hypothetical protein